MKVSVIIPVYNSASFVERAIRSALAQPEVAECLVIDDGSTDSSLDLCMALQRDDVRVKVLQHAYLKNHGPGASRNLGLAKVEYPYVAFLDADDYFLDGRFEKTEALFLQNKNAAAVCEAIATEDWNGDLLSPKLTMLKWQFDPKSVFLEMAPFGNKGHFSLCGLTIQTEIVKSMDRFSEKLRLCQDTEWIARLVLQHFIVMGTIDNPVTIRGVHDANSSKNEKLLIGQRVKMCLILLQWIYDKRFGDEIKTRVVNVLLKYHFEKNQQATNALFKKAADLSLISDLLLIDKKIFRFPKVEYFRRLVFHLPIEQHENFYD